MMTIVLVSIGGIYVGRLHADRSGRGRRRARVSAMRCGARSLGGGALSTILVETVNTTALVFLILIGALVFGPFLALSGLPEKIAQSLAGLDVPRVVILILVLAVYILLGTFLEGFSMLVLTLPIVIPIMHDARLRPDLVRRRHGDRAGDGTDRPAGRHQRVHRQGPGARRADEPRSSPASLPFWFAMMVCIAILIAFPEIATFIPNTMIGK